MTNGPWSGGDRSFQNPIITDEHGADHGDPFVIEYCGRYFLYHTGRDGVQMYTSPDLVRWEHKGRVLNVVDSPEHWAQTDVWAPEVMYDRGVFYMYAAATRRLGSGKGDDQARRQGIARSHSPYGPFVWDREPLVPDAWSIDGHPFRDDDGALWLFYNIRTEATRYLDGTIGCGNVVDRLIAPDRLEGRPTPVTFPSERWEGNAGGTWYWNEGPFVLKRRGIYYQMYSGGFFGDGTYAVGFATATSPRGPWTKHPGNPILRSGEGILGPGHHCVVRASDGVTPYAIYHGYVPGQRGRKVHADRLFWAGDRPILTGPTAGEQPVPPAPCYDPAIPHWHLAAWVRGRCVTLGDVRVALDGDWTHHVRVVCQDGSYRIFVDGMLARECTGAACGPELEVDGTVESLVRTSWLDDDRIYDLDAGHTQRWSWGGLARTEVSIAVKGVAEIVAHGKQAVSRRVESPDGYKHVLFEVNEGMDFLEVRSERNGTCIADVMLAARPSFEARVERD